MSIALLLIVIAGVLAVVELINSRGHALLGWAVLALAVAASGLLR